MRGDLVLDRITDLDLRRRWHQHLSRLSKAIKGLPEARMTADNDPTGLAYLEAAMEFVDARDAERTFYWDTFVRRGTPDMQFTHVETDGDTTQRIRVAKPPAEQTAAEQAQTEQTSAEQEPAEGVPAEQAPTE